MANALTGKPAGLTPYHFLISTLVGERVIEIAEVRAEVLHCLFNALFFLASPRDYIFFARPEGSLDGMAFFCWVDVSFLNLSDKLVHHLHIAPV
jgi:hypothetical protein